MSESMTGGQAYLLFFKSLAGFFLPLMALMGFMGMSGMNTVTLNGANVYGITALITALVLGLVFPAILAGCQTLGFLLVRLVDRRKTGKSEAA